MSPLDALTALPEKDNSLPGYTRIRVYQIGSSVWKEPDGRYFQEVHGGKESLPPSMALKGIQTGELTLVSA